MSDAASGKPPPPDIRPESIREIAKDVFVIPDHRVPLVPNIGVVLGKDGGERDALIEAIGAAPGALGSGALGRLLTRGVDPPTRAKVAEALAGHPEAVDALRGLVRDPDAQVRANALWALGAVGTVREVAGMIACSEWTGVPLSVLLKEVGVRAGATWILAEGADRITLGTCIPLGKAMNDTIVAYAQNGEPVRPQNGFPLRLVARAKKPVPYTEIHAKVDLGVSVRLGMMHAME